MLGTSRSWTALMAFAAGARLMIAPVTSRLVPLYWRWKYVALKAHYLPGSS